jgi:hypothetical protein
MIETANEQYSIPTCLYVLCSKQDRCAVYMFIVSTFCVQCQSSRKIQALYRFSLPVLSGINLLLKTSQFCVFFFSNFFSQVSKTFCGVVFGFSFFFLLLDSN